MGYETKMLIVRKSHRGGLGTKLAKVETLVINNGDETRETEIVQVYYDMPDEFYYYKNNKSLPLPKGTAIKEGVWCQVVAMIEFSKMGSWPGICSFEDSDGTYVYDPFDGDKIIGLDPYGDYRKFVPIKEILNYVREIKSKLKEPNYLIASAEALLSSFALVNNGYDEFGCLFYGH